MDVFVFHCLMRRLLNSLRVYASIYRSYDNILMHVEQNTLIPSLGRILETAFAYYDNVYQGFAQDTMVREYLRTAHDLLTGRKTQMDLNPFNPKMLVDLTQFKPRGHYTKTAELSYYFRAMMYLSRADMALLIGASPYSEINPEKLREMKRASLILWDCIVNSGSYADYLEFNELMSYMVGRGDGADMTDIGAVVERMGVAHNIPDYLQEFSESTFDSAVLAENVGRQFILSTISRNDTPDGSYDRHKSERICGFMPQRFALDSYAFSELVTSDSLIPIPNELDVAFLLGDNSALDAGVSNAQSVLLSSRELWDALSPQWWNSTLYDSWLNMLRQLNGVEGNERVSPVFHTAAWRSKMRNTQLASWAHLRHNTILYVKQSYSPIITCSFPGAYVEPYPDFFQAVEQYAGRGYELFKGSEPQVAGYFSDLQRISGRLRSLAQRTAEGRDPTNADVAWLRTIVSHDEKSQAGYGGSYGYKVYNGWYFDLIFDTEVLHNEMGAERLMFSTIADVHTKPADERDYLNKVFHAATGRVQLISAVIETETCKAIMVGPALTYYSVVSESAGSIVRYSNDEWEEMLLNGTAPDRPSWTGAYSY